MLCKRFFARQGEVYGPYIWEEIKKYARRGNIMHDDRLWSQTTGEWIEVSEFSELIPFLNSCISTPESERSQEKQAKVGLGLRGLLAMGLKKKLFTGAIIGGIAGILVMSLFSGDGRTTWDFEQKIEEPIVEEVADKEATLGEIDDSWLAYS